MKRTLYTLIILLGLVGQCFGFMALHGSGVVADEGGCSTQSELYSLSGTHVSNGLSIWETGKNVDAFKITGSGKKLYSITLRTGLLSEGASTTAKLYVSTSLDFSGTNVGEQIITEIPAVSTEFTVVFSDQPILTNATTYYIGIYDPSGAWGTRFALSVVDDVSGDNRYYSTDGLGGTFSQSTNVGIWAEVNVCD